LAVAEVVAEILVLVLMVDQAEVELGVQTKQVVVAPRDKVIMVVQVNLEQALAVEEAVEELEP
jgi:hypothetical protein